VLERQLLIAPRFLQDFPIVGACVTLVEEDGRWKLARYLVNSTALK